MSKTDSPKHKYQFCNIVIEGGGAKGVCAVGTLRALEKHNILINLKRFVGTSAGALIALLLSIGYTAEEMNTVLLNMDMEIVLDDSWGLVRDLYRLYNKYGFHKGNALLKLIKKLIKDKMGNGDITFGELHKKTNKDLITVVTNVSKDQAEYLSHYTYPDMLVADAVRASMALPGVYVPFKRPNTTSTYDILIDGGVSNNYPIGVFDGEYPREMDNLYNTVTEKNIQETLGLKFMGEHETRSRRIYPQPQPINNVGEFTAGILTHMFNRIERSQVKYGYFERSITIPTGNIGTMEFNLTKEQKIKAQNVAEAKATDELNYYAQHGIFPPEESCKD